MLRLATTVLCLSVVLAAPSQHCKHIMSIAGLTSKFNETIAHAIHSMTVDGLKLFHPLATAINHIPTVNMDLSQVEKVRVTLLFECSIISFMYYLSIFVIH